MARGRLAWKVAIGVDVLGIALVIGTFVVVKRSHREPELLLAPFMARYDAKSTHGHPALRSGEDRFDWVGGFSIVRGPWPKRAEVGASYQISKKPGPEALGDELLLRIFEFATDDAADRARDERLAWVKALPRAIERTTTIPGAVAWVYEEGRPPRRKVRTEVLFTIGRCQVHVIHDLHGVFAPAKLEDTPPPHEDAVRDFLESVLPGALPRAQ
jgi:hypothetical protein